MLPPVGAYMPFIEIAAEPGNPTQTAVDSRGVKPTNQASMFLSVVPVLPPDGQPMLACVPVPLWMFCWRILVASYVTPSEKAFTRCTRQRLGSLSVLPFGSTIFLILRGGLGYPPLAIVAYALAISSGETPFSTPPSDSAQ